MSIENAILNALTSRLDDKLYVIAEEYREEYISPFNNALLVRIDSRLTRIGYIFKYAVVMMDDQGNMRFGETFEDGFEEVVEYKG